MTCLLLLLWDRVEVPMLVYFDQTLLVRMLSDLANFLIIGRKDMSRLS